MKMTRNLLLANLLLASFATYAQQQVFKVKAGDYPNQVIPLSEQYRFPEFARGKVLFYGGKTEEAMLNYAYLGGEIVFLKGTDTLALQNRKVVRVVEISDTIFLNDPHNGFCELVASFGNIKLTKKHALARIGSEKGGPYGISYTASSVTNYNSFSNSVSPGGRKLKMDTEAVFSHRVLYFFVDKNDNFLIPGKGSIARLYPKYKEEIAAYLKENPVDFTNEKDLERLLAFGQKAEK